MDSNFDRRLKWTYATHVVPGRPATLREAHRRLERCLAAPHRNDVLVAEVVALGRHDRIDLASGRKAYLFAGDVVGVVYGHRYATRQWRGRVPDSMEVCHLLSGGGVCGEVVDMSPQMSSPTILNPLGFLLDDRGKRVNLGQYGVRAECDMDALPTVVLVVGSAMDSGKTTAAYSIVHGLTQNGAAVCAAKLTGTASNKDILHMEDAGAECVLDFTDAGHASTAQCTREELRAIARNLIHTLAARDPAYIVLEIADGVVQRETEMLLQELHADGCVDYAVYTCNDTLGITEGVRVMTEIGIRPVAVSGWVACSPLAAQEGQSRTDLPVLQRDQLQQASVSLLFPQVNKQAARNLVLPARQPVADRLTRKIVG